VILIQAYGTPKGGVLVELESLDEAGSNDMILFLCIRGVWKEIGRLPSTGYGNHIYRFPVAELHVGDICSLRVRDDEGFYHTVHNLPVRLFQVEAVLMTKEGMWLEWNSSPGLTYDIADANGSARRGGWCGRLRPSRARRASALEALAGDIDASLGEAERKSYSSAF